MPDYVQVVTKLRMRPVRRDDETQFLAAHEALTDYQLGFDIDDASDWSTYVAGMENAARGIDLAEGRVASTFLIAVVDHQIVGRTSIRHELNDFLAHEGGHIGYAVLPDHRRNGYATEILRQSLVIASSLGIDVALLTCQDDNLGSARVIERCGGVLRDKVTAGDGSLTRRYDISLS